MKIHADVETVPVDELIPYHNNPKLHPEEQVDKIASSIKEYGFTQPIVIDGDNGIIIGHGRVQAAEKLGLEKVPAIRREDLTEQEVKALRLADNRVAESGWDEEALSTELEIIDFNEVETGFDMQEIEELVLKEEFAEVETEHDRPEFEDDEWDKGEIKDNNWFFITYYGQDERFDKLLDKLESIDAARTKHEIYADVFEHMLEVYLNHVKEE